MRRVLTIVLLMASAAAAPEAGHAQAPDRAAVLATVDAYHAALESGDTAAVRSLLTDDAIIQESGGIETRAEYFSHHLPADMGPSSWCCGAWTGNGASPLSTGRHGTVRCVSSRATFNPVRSRATLQLVVADGQQVR